jgi:hypothetical protein
MGFDSQGSSGSGEGSDATPGGYRPPPGYPPPPDTHGTQIIPPPGYVPSAYPSPAPPPPPSDGGYAPPPQFTGYAPPPAPPGYGAPGGYGGYPPAYGYGAPAPHTDGSAITALILSIASFVFCPIVPAIIALALIPGARRNIVSSGGVVEGLGMLTAAKIISWINIGLWSAGLVILAIGIAASSNSSTSPTAIAAIFSF